MYTQLSGMYGAGTFGAATDDRARQAPRDHSFTHFTAMSRLDAQLVANYFGIPLGSVTITGAPLLDGVASHRRVRSDGPIVVMPAANHETANAVLEQSVRTISERLPDQRWRVRPHPAMEPSELEQWARLGEVDTGSWLAESLCDARAVVGLPTTAWRVASALGVAIAGIAAPNEEPRDAVHLQLASRIIADAADAFDVMAELDGVVAPPKVAASLVGPHIGTASRNVVEVVKAVASRDMSALAQLRRNLNRPATPALTT